MKKSVSILLILFASCVDAYVLSSNDTLSINNTLSEIDIMNATHQPLTLSNIVKGFLFVGVLAVYLLLTSCDEDRGVTICKIKYSLFRHFFAINRYSSFLDDRYELNSADSERQIE